MVKKLFALASVTALTGFVSAVSASGCSSTEVVQDQPGADSGPGAAKDSGKPVAVKDTGTVDDDSGEPPATTCLDTTAIDATKFPYKKALVAAKACNDADVKALNTYVEGLKPTDSIDTAAWAKSVSANCAACVFSDGTKDTWTPVITKTGNKISAFNRGGCMEIQSGSTACGAAYQRFFNCATQACASKCTTQADYDACRKDSKPIFSGPCKGAVDAVTKDCDANQIDAWETACTTSDGTTAFKYVYEGAIKYQCVVGSADAGPG